MCATSAIYDYGRQHFPVNQWTRPVFNDFQEIIRRLDKLDAHFNQADCVDPEKAAWTQAVEERLAALEQA